jgi:two-component system, OmpR family, alkaline phosphatase synthesis response regulator PhoP
MNTRATFPTLDDTTLVVVTADEQLARRLGRLFEVEGFLLERSHNALSALRLLRVIREYLLIVDLQLRNRSGYNLCRRLLRVGAAGPIIALGRRRDVAGKLWLLELGISDYITIPFDDRELLARVRVALRSLKQVKKDGRFVFGDVTVDLPKMEVSRGSTPVALGKKAFEVLKFMIDNQQRVIYRHELLEGIWSYDRAIKTRAVDQQIVKLRQKLEKDPAHPVHFRTVHGVGYKFIP